MNEENLGKPKGAKNKFGRELKEVFKKVFDEINAGDPKAKYNLRQWAEDNPGDFYNIISKMLPKEIDLGNQDGEVLKVEWEK